MEKDQPRNILFLLKETCHNKKDISFNIFKTHISLKCLILFTGMLHYLDLNCSYKTTSLNALLGTLTIIGSLSLFLLG